MSKLVNPFKGSIEDAKVETLNSVEVVIPDKRYNFAQPAFSLRKNGTTNAWEIIRIDFDNEQDVAGPVQVIEKCVDKAEAIMRLKINVANYLLD